MTDVAKDLVISTATALGQPTAPPPCTPVSPAFEPPAIYAEIDPADCPELCDETAEVAEARDAEMAELIDDWGDVKDQQLDIEQAELADTLEAATVASGKADVVLDLAPEMEPGIAEMESGIGPGGPEMGGMG